LGGEIDKRKERKHQGLVSSALLSLSLLGKHTHIITEYKFGLKHLLLGHWVGFKRFSHYRKFHTHLKQVNWELDSKISSGTLG